MRSSDFWSPVFVFAASMIVYLFTVCRTVYVGDSGELALAAAQLQIAHPPGYPLLTVVGRVWSLIVSFLRPILALNILSALLASAAAVVLYGFVKRLAGRPGVTTIIWQISIPVAFAFAQSIWFHASAFEVHTLSALLIMAVIYSLSRVIIDNSRRHLIMAAYLAAMALTNHLAAIALLPALLLVVFSRRGFLRLRTIILAVIAFLIPLSAYLYLPFRSQHDLVLTWYNPQTWIGFKQHVLAEAYQRYIDLITWGDIPAYLVSVADTLEQQFFLPWVIPALIGFFVQYRRSRRLAIALLSIVLVNVILNSAYAISDLEPYFIPTIIVLIIWLSELLAAFVRKSEFLTATAALLASAFAIAAMVGNYNTCNLRDNHEAETYALELFSQVPQNGILFCGSDNSTFPTLYLRYAEQMRTDIDVYGQLPTLVRLQKDLASSARPGWSFFPELLEVAIHHGQRPITMAQELMNYDNDFHNFVDTLYPAGLVYFTRRDIERRYLQAPLSLADRIPLEITDPKLARLYALYSLAAANSSVRVDKLNVSEYFDQAEDIVLSQEDPRLYTALTGYLIAEERLARARRIAEAAAKLPALRKSERERIYLALARSTLRMGDHDAARDWFEKLLAIDAEQTEARFQLLALDADQAARQNDIARAVDLYRQMTQVAPDQLQSYYRLGQLHLQLGDTASAVAAWRHCIANDYRTDELVPRVKRLTQ